MIIHLMRWKCLLFYGIPPDYIDSMRRFLYQVQMRTCGQSRLGVILVLIEDCVL